MYRHRLGALIAALLAVACAHAAEPQRATFVGRFVWSNDAGWFGGFSALEIYDGGKRFLALSDHGLLVRGELTYEDGRIVGTRQWRMYPLLNPERGPLDEDEGDSEGIALAPDGSFFVSFELEAGIAYYAAPGAPGRLLPNARNFGKLQKNSGLEALAIDDRGRLYTIPERSGRITRPFPVYRWDGNRWSVPFSLTRTGDFLVVGADFGPDGRLYVLERDFTGVFGFRSRVRAFDAGGPEVQAGETILETALGSFGNLEGLSVWTDDTGATRLTMLCDDNYNGLLSTEFVEYRLDPLAAGPEGH
jgi:hypothetical protein